MVYHALWCFWAWAAMSSDPTSLYTFFTPFNAFWGIFALVGGRALPGPLPPLVVNTTILRIAFVVVLWGFFLYPYALLGVLGFLVQSLLVAALSEVAGPFFLHFFCLCFSCLMLYIFLLFILGIFLPVF